MKKTLTFNPLKKTILFLMLVPCCNYLQAQQVTQTTQVTYVNKINETVTGQTDTIQLAPIAKVGNNVVVSSNQKVSSTQNDIKTVGLNNNWVIWLQQLFNVNNRKAFTTATTTDAQGNYYIAGSTYINAINGQDLTVIKYNSSMVQQWVRHYNGPGIFGNNYDIASGIVVDNVGNVFVTGASMGAMAALVDYVVIKYSSAGTQQWVARYNGANGMDIPTDIVLDNNGNPIVTGSSASSAANTNLDATTVKYNAATGAQLMVQKQINAGIGQDKVLAETRDNAGNIYVTGGVTFNGIDYDVQTIKYDANLNPVWVKTYDGYGKTDLGNDIAIDNNGNVVVTGYATKSNLTKELLVLSYNSNGNLNWKSLKQSKIDNSNCEGTKIKIKSSSEIFVGGNYTENNNSNMAILRFNNLGENNLEKTYNGVNNLNDRLLDIMIDGNFIIVSGQTNNGLIDQNVVIKYEYLDVNTPSISQTQNGSDYQSNTILIYFNKSALKMNKINNKDFTFGKLSDFVEDSTCNKINKLVNSKLKCQEFMTSKIYSDLAESDSISISRQGDIVKVPPFYGGLAIQVPSTFNVILGADTIGDIKPDVNFASLNYLYQINAFSPNDPIFANNQQSSLISTPTFPNANINCVGAWDYTKGKSFIKVGVYDTGIDYTNSDLSGTVAGGYDFYFNTGVNPSDNSGHGTSCAGIIGAKTNNNNGIAGIAGGDNANNQSGITLFAMRIANASFVSSQTISQAIVKGAGSSNVGGYELHVMSNSYGADNASYDQPINDGINYANRNGVVFCVASGNSGLNHPASPANLKEQTILCIGSSGQNGHYQNPSNGDNYSPNYGYPLDLVAPGTSQIIQTTKPGTNSFGNFNGTSAATPHAAGAAALLLSYVNQSTPSWDNLTHEDCEEILQRSCIDLDGLYGESAGYDQFTGHGRLNIGNALAMLEQPKYKIRHIDPSHYVTSVSKSVNTVVSSQLKYFAGTNVIVGDNYIVDVYETITTLNYSIGPNEQVKGSWPLYKASTGTSYYSPNILTDEPWYCEVLSATNTQAVLRTYSTLIKYNILAQAINYQYPASPLSLNSGFSLYTYDPTAISIKENSQVFETFNIYPNPNNGNFTLGINAKTANNCELNITNVMGSVVYTKIDLKLSEGINKINVATSNLQSGIYFVTLKSNENKSVTKKMIIN